MSRPSTPPILRLLKRVQVEQFGAKPLDLRDYLGLPPDEWPIDVMGHWIWTGSYTHPRPVLRRYVTPMGELHSYTGTANPRPVLTGVESVTRTIYEDCFGVEIGPYRLQRNKERCDNQKCVSPFHFWVNRPADEKPDDIEDLCNEVERLFGEGLTTLSELHEALGAVWQESEIQAALDRMEKIT